MAFEIFRPIVVSLFLSSLSLSSSLSIDSSLPSSPFAGNLSTIESYARVSMNGARPITLTDRDLPYRQSVSESRSFANAGVARSPVYVPGAVKGLRKGEVLDHSEKYSTIDREALARLDKSRTRAQDRFHPPASFEHSIAHSNAMRDKYEYSGSGNTQPEKPKFPVPSYATLPKELYSPSYEYQNGESPPTNDDEPAPPPATGDSPDSADDSFSKIPDSYAQPEIYNIENSKDVPKFSNYPASSSYGEAVYPAKPADFSDLYEHQRPSYEEGSFFSHHDLIYDQPPEDHYHHDHPMLTTTTTEEPEMNDQRLSKRPYSYYYIGKKLWYLPLYFSIYFIIYIAALVLKSITRHKINFPASLAAAAANARHSGAPFDEPPGWLDLTKRVLDGIDLYNSIGKSKVS